MSDRELRAIKRDIEWACCLLRPHVNTDAQKTAGRALLDSVLDRLDDIVPEQLALAERAGE